MTVLLPDDDQGFSSLLWSFQTPHKAKLHFHVSFAAVYLLERRNSTFSQFCELTKLSNLSVLDCRHLTDLLIEISMDIYSMF